MNQPRISLIIPAYNEEGHIGPCLASAIANGKGRFKEIIVVNNGSSDRTAEIASTYPGVRVVSETRKGTGHARQTGAEAATGEILAYIDADVSLHDGWVDFIEKIFDRRPKLVFLSGPYRYRRHAGAPYPAWLLNVIWWVTPPFYWIVGFMGNGGNCVMRAEALKKIGGHDRSIAFYGDDTDLARRFHQIGETLWTLRFYNYTSARRFYEIGVIKTCAKYVINYWWPVLFRRPFSTGHHDLKRT